MDNRDWPSHYLLLHPQASLKRLEAPCIYHSGQDELYEINEQAEDFLKKCDGTHKAGTLTTDSEFVEYCLEEGLLEIHESPYPIKISLNNSVKPSLRYLELQLLNKCNLTCTHCYLGTNRSDEMALADALAITREFSETGGLKLLITGGEPLLYKDLKRFIEETAELKLRRVVLTNGTLISSHNIKWLKVEEIQFSLDGMKKGHDMIRGKGAFEKTIKGAYAAKESGISISFATMAHKGNLDEFDSMRDLIEGFEALEWNIDVPVLSGYSEKQRNLRIPSEVAVPYMNYSFGGGTHGPSEGYACGRHLLTVLPTGFAVKCGFYENHPLGDARKGLKECWLKLEHIPLEQLECKGCSVIKECAGGCRFRAPHYLAPDPVMCTFYGLSK
jgi:radical SAM protein with 4Fe4S-binding SPASM domain